MMRRSSPRALDKIRMRIKREATSLELTCWWIWNQHVYPAYSQVTSKICECSTTYWVTKRQICTSQSIRWFELCNFSIIFWTWYNAGQVCSSWVVLFGRSNSAWLSPSLDWWQSWHSNLKITWAIIHQRDFLSFRQVVISESRLCTFDWFSLTQRFGPRKNLFYPSSVSTLWR